MGILVNHLSDASEWTPSPSWFQQERKFVGLAKGLKIDFYQLQAQLDPGAQTALLLPGTSVFSFGLVLCSSQVHPITWSIDPHFCSFSVVVYHQFLSSFSAQPIYQSIISFYPENSFSMRQCCTVANSIGYQAYFPVNCLLCVLGRVI